MKNSRTPWIKRTGMAILVLLVILWFLSPYKRQDGFPYRLIKNTIEIDASADRVFRFLGNSANASRWSVFVDHISTLNPVEVADGKVGSRRRCYRQTNEKGEQWDEIITEVLPAEKRQIRCYNMRGFAISSEGVATEQLYRPLGPDKCELTFTLYYVKGAPSWLDELKIRLASYYIKRVFARNMENIKSILSKQMGESMP